jgi:P27 family predicted phage terminase small subunit
MSGIPGRGGPKPKPTLLHIVRGSKAAKARNRPEPIAPGRLAADAPDWLTESQKEGWRYAIENAPLSLLRRIDRSLLVAWVVAEDVHRHAAQKVAQFGLLTKAPNTGMPIQSPYLPIVNRQALIMIRTAAELGFTPSARSRIALGETQPNPDDNDPADEFFRA